MKNAEIARDISSSGKEFYDEILASPYTFKVSFFWKEKTVYGDGEVEIDDFASSEEFASSDMDSAWVRAEEIFEDKDYFLYEGIGLNRSDAVYVPGSLQILDVDCEGF